MCAWGGEGGELETHIHTHSRVCVCVMHNKKETEKGGKGVANMHTHTHMNMHVGRREGGRHHPHLTSSGSVPQGGEGCIFLRPPWFGLILNIARYNHVGPSLAHKLRVVRPGLREM